MLLIIPGERFSSLIVLNVELLMGWTAWVCIPYILIVSLSLNDSQNAYDMMPETFLFSLFPQNILRLAARILHDLVYLQVAFAIDERLRLKKSTHKVVQL